MANLHDSQIAEQSESLICEDVTETSCGTRDIRRQSSRLAGNKSVYYCTTRKRKSINVNTENPVKRKRVNITDSCDSNYDFC